MKEFSFKSESFQQQKSSVSSYDGLLRKSKPASDSDSIWLITLSDVLLLLLVFFIAFSVLTKNAGGREKTPPADDRKLELPDAKLVPDISPLGETIKNRLTSEIDNLDLKNDIFVAATSKEIVITMKEKVTFSPGEADILNSPGPVLMNIAEIIRKYPKYIVEITGHTDNVPIKTERYPSNWELSVARATSVLKYFINTCGLDPSRFSVKGSADQQPVAPNDTPEDRAQNRRVEIRLKDTETQG